jgi:acylphosphatase
LQQRYQRTAREGVQRLLKKELKGLGEAERTAIQTWCDVLARRFAHIPCLGIRGLVHSGPDGSVEAFLSGLESEFADELRAALASQDSDARMRAEGDDV